MDCRIMVMLGHKCTPSSSSEAWDVSSLRVQSHIIRLYDYVIKMISLYLAHVDCDVGLC